MPLEDAMAVLQRGFDGGLPPRSRHQQIAWRVGRWLREQGAARPASLHRADDGVMIVNGQILVVDAEGQIQNLSTTRRVVRTPLVNWEPL
ncbi:hypothetical protein [Caulobacter soli]|uniref:hypothetical protein n=1 Tax=Caulobacter soli TaxID=2708539 RepID=UPI0013EDDF18|nr:hypothetical protein [Caulobacter soli]